MDLRRLKVAYSLDKSDAKSRGIEWRFTFETWVAWWGDDIIRRGIYAWNLQMQRVADAGPYSPDNVRKGTPKRNGETYSAVYRTKKQREIKQQREAALDESMRSSDANPSKDWRDEDDHELNKMFGVKGTKW